MKKILKYLIAILTLCLFINVEAKSYTEDEYKTLNVTRGYVVGEYVFDINSYNPTLKDFLLAAQTCPVNNVTIYEIKYAKNLQGQVTSTYTELLTNQKLNSFPNINLTKVLRGAVGSSNEVVLDSNSSATTIELEKISVDSNKLNDMDLKRIYVVGAYIFDINSHNPTLKDFLLANQTAELGTAKIYEIKIATDINGNPTESYKELLDNQSLNNFPTLLERYVYYGDVNPAQPNSESKIDLLNGGTGGEVSAIKLSEPTVSIKKGETKQIEVSVLPTNATNNGFTWESSNEDVATVENGLITAKTSGTATITVTSSNGTKAYIEVTVLDNDKIATIICEDKVFNGTPQAIAVCSGGTVENQIQTYGGNYQITCTGDDEHDDALPTTCKILRTDTTTSLSSKETVYNGDVQPMTGATSTYNSTNETISNAAYTYKYYSDSACTENETTNAPVNAGDYYVKAVLTLHTDYNSSESSCVLYRVNKLDNTFVIKPKEVEYTGYGINADVEMTYSQLDEDLKVNLTYYSDSTCTTLTNVNDEAANNDGGAPIAAGIYYVKGVTEDNSNYNTITSDCELAVTITSVDPICPQITSFEGDYTIDPETGEAVIRRFSVVNPAQGGTVMYCVESDTVSCDVDANWSTELPTRSTAGTTTVKVKVVGDNGHNTVYCNDETIKINKIDNDINLTFIEENYTSLKIEANVKAEEVTRDQIDVQYFYNDPYCLDNAVDPINAGVYYVKVTTPETANYKETTSKCLLGLRIKQTATTTTLGNIEYTYNGNPQLATGASSVFNSNEKDISTSTNPIDKPDNGNPSYTYTYYTDQGCNEMVENNYAPTNAGNYYVKATLNGTINYLSSDSECMRYIMNPKTDVITVDYNSDGVLYTGDYVEATATNLSGNDITFTYYTDSGCENMTDTTNAVGVGMAPKNAGTYWVIATTEQDPTNNYSNINNVTNTNYTFATTECTIAVKINKAPVEITCEDKVYNRQEQVIASCKGGTIHNNVQTNVLDEGYEITCTGDVNHTDRPLDDNGVERDQITATCRIIPADSKVEVIGNNQDINNNAELRKVYRDYNGTSQELDKDDDNIKSYVFDPNDERDPIVLTEISDIATYTYTYYTDPLCTLGGMTNAPVNAGIYFAKATLNVPSENSNYNSSYDCVQYTVKRIQATVNVTYQSDVEYSGNVVNAIGETNSGSTITYRYYTDNKCSHPTTTAVANAEGGAPFGVNPEGNGIYYVIATTAQSTNYEQTEATVNGSNCIPAFNIIKKASTCPEINNYTGVYSTTNVDTPPTISVTTPAIGGDVRYKVDGSGESSTDGAWVVDPPTRTNAGTTIIHVKVVGDSNHEDNISCPDATIEITPKTDIVTVNPTTPNDRVVEVDYDGGYHEASAISESQSEVNIVYYTDASCSTSLDGKPINAGTYYVKATSTAQNPNYSANTPVCTKAVVINKVYATCPVISEVIEVYSPGTKRHIIVSGTPQGGELQFKNGESGDWVTTNPEIENVSESTNIYVRVYGDQNHKNADCGARALTIKKAPSTITCEPNVVYTGGQHNIASCSGGTVSGNLKTNAGFYEVTCTGSANYENSVATCEIRKSNTTTNLPQITKTYNGQPQAASGATSILSSTGNSISGGAYTYEYFHDGSCTEVSDVPKYGGVYFVKAKLTATSNYNSSESACTRYTMNQTKPAAAINCLTKTYNGEEQVIATCNGGTISGHLRTDAGTYTVMCTGDNEHSDNTASCTMAKANSQCPALSSYTGTYDENPHRLNGNPLAVGGTAEYKLNKCQTENYSGNPSANSDCVTEWTSNWDQTYVDLKGTTYVYVRVIGNNNYNGIDSCGPYTITLN